MLDDPRQQLDRWTSRSLIVVMLVATVLLHDGWIPAAFVSGYLARWYLRHD